MTHIDPRGIVVVMTEYGPYEPHPVEINAFRQAYGHEPNRKYWHEGLFFSGFMPSSTARWEDELIDYATEQKRQELETQ